MRLIPPVLAAALLLALGTTAALADDAKPHRRPARPDAAAPGLAALIARADRDGDGALSRTEIAAVLRAVASRRGAGADRGPAARARGRRAAARTQRPQAPRLLVAFRHMDRDGDGQLSMREFASGMMRAHAALRMQGGGMQGHGMAGRGMQGRGMQGRGMQGRGMQGRGMQGRGMAGRGMHGTGLGAGLGLGMGTGQGWRMGQGMPGRGMRGPDAPERGARARGSGGPDAAAGPQAAKRRAQAQGQAVLARLRAADADGDGRLSEKEAPPLLRKHFARVDADGDGLLSPAELKRAVGALVKAAREAHGDARPRREREGADDDAPRGKGPKRAKGEKSRKAPRED